MTVDEMVDTILAHEGGFVDDPDDRGGATNYGITQLTYSRWLDRPASVEDVRAMSAATAKEIYLTNYYYAPRINSLPAALQPQVFDCSINHGPVRAIKFVQSVCNLAGFGPITVDGVVGPQTLKTVQLTFEAMGDYFINAIADERIHFYQQIVANDPTQQKFINGWLNRANSFKQLTGSLA